MQWRLHNAKKKKKIAINSCTFIMKENSLLLLSAQWQKNFNLKVAHGISFPFIISKENTTKMYTKQQTNFSCRLKYIQCVLLSLFFGDFEDFVKLQNYERLQYFSNTILHSQVICRFIGVPFRRLQCGYFYSETIFKLYVLHYYTK